MLKSLLILIVLFPTLSLAKSTITIFIRDDVHKDYLDFLAGRHVSEIDNFSGKTVRRDVVDMIIAQQALLLGGFEYEYSYYPGKVNFRNTALITDGDLLISFDSYWKKDAERLQDDVFISSPVIRKGEYVAGIYTHPSNTKVLSVTTLDELQRLSAVSTPKWQSDWSTLEALKLNRLVREDEWLSMAQMVNRSWVDFMLMPFHASENGSFNLGNIHLIPVPNIAILLDDSRHYVISKKHPLGKQAFQAINIGLEKLRQKQQISKAYQQAGFFIDQQKYKILNK